MEQEVEFPPSHLVYGNVRIDPGRYGVSVGDRAVDLTYYEFELLEVLCREAGRIVKYEVLCQELWHASGLLERRRLSVAVCRLRSKLAASWPYKVETVRGRGYGFIPSEARPAVG